MKNYVPFPSSLKISCTSASLVWEIWKQLKVFSCFPKQNLICYFSIWWKEEHQQLVTYHKLTELLIVHFFINVRKNCHSWSLSISHSFVGICYIYRENFYFGFDIKTIPVYFPTHLNISSILHHPSFTTYSRFRICFILLLQKIVS